MTVVEHLDRASAPDRHLDHCRHARRDRLFHLLRVDHQLPHRVLPGRDGRREATLSSSSGHSTRSRPASRSPRTAGSSSRSRSGCSSSGASSPRGSTRKRSATRSRSSSRRSCLFAMGAFVALLTLPKALEFLLNVGGSELRPELTADKYLVARLAHDRGVRGCVRVPRGAGVPPAGSGRHDAAAPPLAPAGGRGHRGRSPPSSRPSQDPYSLFFMAVPMYLFYEISIIIGRVLKR